MDRAILKLAQETCGAEEGSERLKLLCAAAREAWKKKLRPDVTEEACRAAICCAAALIASADYLSGEAESGASFSAGEVSVQGIPAAQRAAELRETAQRLMAPYVVSGAICFRSVRA